MKSKISEFFENKYYTNLPVIPLVGIHSARIANIDIQKALVDGSLMAKAELKALKSYN